MYNIFKKALFALDPETAHNAVKSASAVAPLGLIRKVCHFEHATLKTVVNGTEYTNPIGLAAGFDKNGDMVPFLTALGFGFLELGSVTALPCFGNERPRIFRLTKEGSLINWMGLPNVGTTAFAKKMQCLKTTVPLGINIAKTPDFAYERVHLKLKNGIDDFVETYKALHGFGCYTVFNLSCPNTGEALTFEHPELFREFARTISELNKRLKDAKPVYLKLSPDLDAKELAKLVELACQYGFDGFVVSNTTRTRPKLTTPLTFDLKKRGGLSGRALTQTANLQLKRVYEIVGREKTLIAVGGIMSFDDLMEKFALGAELCQIYTGLIYNGPLFVRELCEKLAHFCEEKGLKSYREIVGCDVMNMP